jgi:hypothetical protein
VSRVLRAGLAALALMTVGCGGEGSPDAEAPTTTADPVAAARERLAGRYAHYDVVAYEGDGMKTLIVSYGFTDLIPQGDELVSADSFCFSEHRSDQPIEVSFSDAATQAIKPESVAVALKVAEGRARVSRPETPTGIGVRLEDPANDPLPTDPADPRIADDDGDGKPGVTATIRVSDTLSGEIYLARREIFAYEADEQADGSLRGYVIDRSEQLVVGASDPIFMTDAQWTQHPDPAKSPIILLPVESSWDCERLRAERPKIFPPTPEVDW